MANWLSMVSKARDQLCQRPPASSGSTPFCGSIPCLIPPIAAICSATALFLILELRVCQGQVLVDVRQITLELRAHACARRRKVGH